MGPKKLTADQLDAMRCLFRNGWNCPNATGLGVQTYRALVRRGLMVHVDGQGQKSTFALTEDGEQFCLDMLVP
jgi:uncharacterized protein YjhX (UPF0386 family)